MPIKLIEELEDQSVQGIWEASRAAQLAGGSPLEDMVLRSAALLVEKSYWGWMLTSASEQSSSWQDLRGNYWVVDPEDGEISERGT